MELLTDRYSKKIEGKLSCYDRVVITGTLPELCYSQGMTNYLNKKGIKIFDYPKFAEPYRDQIRNNAEGIAKVNGIQIEFIRKPKLVRKEELVQKVLKKRGDHPGIVHILSVMETCSTYQPWHDKILHKTYLKGNQSKCLHYYFYFIDKSLGLCYVRVPTWCPFRLQIYFNGHNWLASKLDKSGIGYELMDNAFVKIDDWKKAQELADGLNVKELHESLDRFAEKYCPVFKHFGQVFHWSFMQAEFATDIVFKRQKDLQQIYGNLIQTSIHTIKPENIATFFGKKIHGNYKDEVGNQYNIRIQGSRIKHQMGKNSIKMYDKFAQILRIETTTNDISFFQHYRRVEHRDGSSSKKFTGMKKNIYSLSPLKKCLQDANRRYLEFISAIEDKTIETKRFSRVTQPVKEKGRNYRGFNFFCEKDNQLFEALLKGQFNISGFQSKDLRKLLPDKSKGQIYRMVKSLRLHGLIKKVRNTYKYYLTKLGKTTLINSLKLKQLVVIPQYSY